MHIKYTNPHFKNNPFVPYKTVFNEITPKIISTGSMNPFDMNTSGSRKQMFSTHLGQAIVPRFATEAFLQSGTERKFGKATFGIRAPDDLRVFKVMSLYPKSFGQDAINYNPVRYVLYEDSTGAIGLLTLTDFIANHPRYGYRLKPFEAASELHSDGYIAKDASILEPSNLDEDGTYRIGIEVPTAMISDPAVADDGLVFCDSAIKMFSYYGYERRNASCGSKRFPLNAYGDDDNYKICPEIGELIRPDGILMAFREYDDLLAGIEQSVDECQIIDDVTDFPLRAEPGVGRVIDIRVMHDRSSANGGLPKGMDQQLLKYDKAQVKFYQDLIAEVDAIKRVKKKDFKSTFDLHEMLVMAHGVTSIDTKARVSLAYAQVPLDTWHITFVVEYERVPGMGSKFTGYDGDKGVVTCIRRDEDMPVDAAGRRALIIADCNSTTNRQNPGRPIAHNINSYRETMREKIRDTLKLDRGDRNIRRKVEEFHKEHPDKFEELFNHLIHFYDAVSPVHASAFTANPSLKDDLDHIAYIIERDIYLHIPNNNQRETIDTVELLERHFDQVNGPVRYAGFSGVHCMTKDNVVVAYKNWLMLEKQGEDWGAVSSARTQMHGVLSQVTRGDKYRYAWRLQSPRWLGETEVRELSSYMGPIPTAEVMDRNNNPFSHTLSVDAVLSALYPTRIKTLINRDDYPIDGSQPLKLFKHIIGCAGWGIEYVPYRNVNPKPMNYNH